MLIFSIVYTAVLLWVCALVQNLTNLKVHGAAYVGSDRSQSVSEAGVSGRMARTLRNHTESALMYIPIALAAVALHITSSVLFWAATAYMALRTTYTIGYWFGINPLRAASWLGGMICIAAAAVTVLIASNLLTG